MKRLLSLVFVSLFCFSASSEVLDPTFEDSAINEVYQFIQQTGAITLDTRTSSIFVNEWEVSTELVELKGETLEEVNAAWAKMLVDEKKRLLDVVNEYSPDIKISTLDNSSITELMTKNDGITVLLREGTDNDLVRSWLVNEFFTPVTKAQIGWYFEDNSRDEYEYFQFHVDEMSSETLGESVLFIRGVSSVLVVRIRFCYC